MVNDITAANPSSNLLVKYADDITLSVPVRSGAVDQSQAEVNTDPTLGNRESNDAKL